MDMPVSKLQLSKLQTGQTTTKSYGKTGSFFKIHIRPKFYDSHYMSPIIWVVLC